MKLTGIVLFMYSLNILSQTAHDFLISCFEEERKKGASSIILNATLCSACIGEATYEGFIFIKDTSQTYKVRYLKYLHRPASVKILEDKIFIDDDIKSIFKILDTHQDSIFWQVSNIEHILNDTIYENGKKIYSWYSPHGKMRYLNIHHNGKLISSIQQIICLNEIFDRAYYYWLLNSAINNYINDSLRFLLTTNKGKKRKEK